MWVYNIYIFYIYRLANIIRKLVVIKIFEEFGLLEKDIEKFLNDNVKKLGGRSYKFVSPGNSGVPDRIIFLPGGKIYFVELKTKRGRPSALQKLQRRRFKELGHEVYLLYGLEDVKVFLNGIT